MRPADHLFFHLPDKRQLQRSAREWGDHAGDLVLRGRLLGRRGGRHIRHGAWHAADFAEDLGERSAHQAARLGRQIKRHPVAAVGVAAAVAGAAWLACRWWKQRQRPRYVQPPIIDDIEEP